MKDKWLSTSYLGLALLQTNASARFLVYYTEFRYQAQRNKYRLIESMNSWLKRVWN